MATNPVGAGFIQDPSNSYVQYKDTHGNTLISVNRDGSLAAGTFQLVDEAGLGLLLHPAEILFPDGTAQSTAAVAPGPVTSIQGVAISAVPPTVGQVVTATSATSADWATPAGGQITQSQRVHVGVIASATPSAIISMPWTAPFADNNYTVVGSVVVAETPSDGAATAICCIGMIQYQAGGAGINFVVCNADGVSHDVTAQFYAVHD